MSDNSLEQFIKSTTVVAEEDFEFAYKKSKEEGKDILQTLVSLGLIAEDQAQRLHALYQGIAFVDLQRKPLSPEDFLQIPEAVSREHELVCFKKDIDGKLNIACVDIKNIEKVKEIIPDAQIIPSLTDRTSMKTALKAYQKYVFETGGSQLSAMLASIKNPEKFKGQGETLPVRFHTEITQDNSSSKILEEIIKQALSARASNIYFNPEQEKIRINFRISGKQYEAINIDSEALPGIIARLKYSIDRPILKDDTGVGFAKIEVDGRTLPLQVLFFETQYGTKTVLRILNNNELFDSIDLLFISKSQREFLYTELPRTPSIIISGGSDAGVTRGYYALLEHLRNIYTEIISIEDLIEAPLNGITQISTYKKKDKTRLCNLIMATGPEVVGFSPFNFTDYLGAFTALKGNTKICFETETITSFIKSLTKHDLSTRSVISRLGLAIVHQKFPLINPSERKDYKLTSEDILLLAPYFSFGELRSIFSNEGLLNTDSKDLSVITFSVKKKEQKRKIKEEFLYARGVFSISNILSENESPVQSITVFENYVNKMEKKSIIENALIACAQGKVSFDDIKLFIKK